jgi:hypothetical protein
MLAFVRNDSNLRGENYGKGRSKEEGRGPQGEVIG